MITQEEFLKAELEMNLTMDNPDFVALAESVFRYVERYPYATLIDYYCRAAPYNWFNFFDFWQAPSTRNH
jgi:predicted LPLAT superfamily acyltransferase